MESLTRSPLQAGKPNHWMMLQVLASWPGAPSTDLPRRRQTHMVMLLKNQLCPAILYGSFCNRS